jgi:pyruvate,water dikinase
MGTYKYIRWFSEVNRNDIPLVGGKGANLGELTQNGVAVPPGFCVIAGAYRDFIRISGLNASIENIIRNIDFENTDDLSEKCGEIRKLIMEAPFPKEIEKEVKKAYAQLAQKTGLENVQVAVRSSATAEDLPDASFAGQQDTYLHIRGAEEVLKHVQKCWASLWTARATYYREKQDFNHFEVALSAVVQKMVRSEKSGVLFTANPVSNDLNQIMINASWGLGEAVVSGVVTPDEFILEKDHLDVVEKTISEKNTMIVEKDGDIGTAKVAVKDFLGPDKVKMQCLTDMEIITLGKAGKTIESLYNAPQDIEWALDQDTKELYILQARPITTLAKGESSVDQNTTPKETKLNVLARGLAASPGTAVGKVIVIEDINEIARVKDGDILVTGMTNPEHFLMEPLSTGQRVFEYQTDVKNVSLWSNCANKALDT